MVPGRWYSKAQWGRALCWVWVLCYGLPLAAYQGRVLDDNGVPLAGALVTLGQAVAETDATGGYQIEGEGRELKFRAYGHGRAVLPLPAPEAGTSMPDVSLRAVTPKALYLTFYGVGSKALRGAALELIDRTELNALVIDVKGDRGRIPYPSGVPERMGLEKQNLTTVRDMRALLAALHERGIYTIGRIVVFKDDPLARARPQWAVKTVGGQVWHDREGLGWVDPFQAAAWEYNLAIAEEAASYGFDEIQFDYVRFPDAVGLAFAKPNTQPNRLAAISGFLASAKRRLAPYNVFLSADIFGYVCWNRDDTQIGQRLEELTPHLDYLSPMLYPSGFQFGIPGFREPLAHPREIVALSLKNARQRTGWPAIRFRPWLQAFRDYAFDRRMFGAEAIRAQIAAAEAFGSGGWMLWNPRNVYSAAGLRAREKKAVADLPAAQGPGSTQEPATGKDD